MALIGEREAMPAAFSSVSPLAGARDVNTGNPLAFASEDLAGKVSILLSFMNASLSAISALNVAVSALNAGAISAANSALTWSAFSTTPTSSILLNSYPGTISNFRS